jgi:hypothetical protein
MLKLCETITDGEYAALVYRDVDRWAIEILYKNVVRRRIAQPLIICTDVLIDRAKLELKFYKNIREK